MVNFLFSYEMCKKLFTQLFTYLFLFIAYTTNELQIPTVNTKRSQILKPEKTTPLFSVQPFGVANTTGTPTTKAKETAINANNAN